VREYPEPGSDEAQQLADLRLASVNQQLEHYAEPVLSSEARELIRRAAAAWALWLECDDAVSELGLDLCLGGGVEFPAEHSEAIGVPEIEEIKLHTVSISRAP